MIYKRKRNKMKIFLALLLPVFLLLVIFRVDIKAYLVADKLKVLGTKESVFFLKEEDDSSKNIKKLSVSDENKGIMIFTIDNSSVDIESIKDKFSGEKLIGRIKKDADIYDGYSSDRAKLGVLVKDTKVEILKHYNSTWYYVRAIESDEKVWVSDDLLSFPYTPRRKKSILTDEEIEVYINSLDIKSPSNNMIYVDLMRQSIYIFENYSGKWDYSKKIKCISGTSRNPILKGEFKIYKKDDYVLSKSEKNIYRYLSKINNGFDIRSMPESTEVSTIISDDEVLEDEITRSKNGDLWLSEDDAKWIYEKIDLNTTIIIK